MTSQKWIRIGNSALSERDGYTIFAQVGTYQSFLQEADEIKGPKEYQENLEETPGLNEKGYIVTAKRAGNRDNLLFIRHADVFPDRPCNLDNFMTHIDSEDILKVVDKQGGRPPVEPEDEIMPYWKYAHPIASARRDGTIVSFSWVDVKDAEPSERIGIFITRPGAKMDMIGINPLDIGVARGTSLEAIGEKFSPAEMIDFYDEEKARLFG